MINFKRVKIFDLGCYVDNKKIAGEVGLSTLETLHHLCCESISTSDKVHFLFFHQVFSH